MARIAGANPTAKADNFAALRLQHRADAHRILNDLEYDHLYGGSQSDITRTSVRDGHDVRIDRQNPPPWGENIQIQTNGEESISISTVLLPDRVHTTAKAKQPAVLTAVRQGFRASLADGMQWEVVDPAVDDTPVNAKPKGKQGGGNKGKKKGGGGGGKGGRRVKT